MEKLCTLYIWIYIFFNFMQKFWKIWRCYIKFNTWSCGKNLNLSCFIYFSIASSLLLAVHCQVVVFFLACIFWKYLFPIFCGRQYLFSSNFNRPFILRFSLFESDGCRIIYLFSKEPGQARIFILRCLTAKIFILKNCPLPNQLYVP